VTTPRQRFLVSLVLVVLVSVGGGWFLSTSDDDSSEEVGVVTLTPGASTKEPGIGTNVPATGKIFPAISTDNVNGDSFNFADLAGKPFVVNFWYSTCEPCKREFPALVAAHTKHGNEVEFVGINPQDTAERAQEFALQYKATYPMVRDPDGKLLSALGVGTFPMTMFVDAGGVVVHQHAGEISAEELTDALAKYLSVT
jgi:cytochrome c biogenesis protein CcmG/thiol:disulfide interchange protein DsbE